MFRSRKIPSVGLAIYFGLCFVLALYFAFASVQGDYGLFRRVEVDTEAARLRAELAELRDDIAMLRNNTRRLSDDYLDLDLLDEQARDILGLVRSDEVVLR
ncbi:hypothetical protein OCGS_2327 [Oceaniovalibus guishaninsula JLT2003]|uniref:Septum formation initiator n=1 Tax=Oceaniovalibus guishaninsula JLT2003 TaxID=1231392 RepID=K2I422_9RHOB|nr:septum formation initiator family protein [Oceaniovalibus guishaninsula]EKE43595.1 hypothetical protein OCGS_2327 [Oceaniovalibus guishaninsula JLT2003]